MNRIPVVYMRGGTSKGLMFLEQDLPPREKWDEVFSDCMGNPDPKQIDGMGGCVSSNNKVVVVRKSERPGVDVDYIVGQSVVGKTVIDYKSNCGNMTSGTAPFAIEAGLVEPLTEPVTVVHMFNLNTNKYINVEVPVKNGVFYNEGDCTIAGVDGTAGELKVNFVNPSGSKTGKLFPTGKVREPMTVFGHEIEVTILDVSNPLVLVQAEDVCAAGTELPAQADANTELCAKLEAIRGEACVRIGLAKSAQDAAENNPGVPKIAFVCAPTDYTDITGKQVQKEQMDICARVISVFKCHKASPLTTACALSVAAFVPGTVAYQACGGPRPGQQTVRIGHPSGVMTMYPYLENASGTPEQINVTGVAVQRTARRIMDGTIYLKQSI